MSLQPQPGNIFQQGQQFIGGLEHDVGTGIHNLLNTGNKSVHQGTDTIIKGAQGIGGAAAAAPGNFIKGAENFWQHNIADPAAKAIGGESHLIQKTLSDAAKPAMIIGGLAIGALLLILLLSKR